MSTFGLWTSQGTIASTFEIGGLGSHKIYGVGNYGFAISELARFGSGALFKGNDWSNGWGLWYTDGTKAGTIEIGGRKNKGVKGVGPYGLQPSSIATFGAKALFKGTIGAANVFGLWATDGTAENTVVLEHARGAYATGLNAHLPGAALGADYLFQGSDLYNVPSLWRTDGTRLGTVEIGGARNAGISGVSANGLAPRNFVVAGTHVFFMGDDSVSTSRLWVSYGTAGGTLEVGGLRNAGVANIRLFNLAQASVGLGKKLLTNALDSAAYSGLWVSDGTASGTFEIGGQGAAAFNNGVGFHLSPYEIVNLGAKALFAGNDPSLKTSALWVTDGTTAGTSKIFSFAPNSQYSSAIRNLTAIGNGKALFSAADASGNHCLFVTNGTAVGTVEIGGLNNHLIKGAAATGLYTIDIVAAGGVGYFHAKDSSNNTELWVSDGTVAGTLKLAGVPGQNSSGLSSTDVTWAP